MDIKEQINSIVDSIKNDAGLMDKFKKDPVKTVEELIGVDLPDDIVKKVVEGVKGKMSVDNVKDVLGSLKKLF